MADVRVLTPTDVDGQTVIMNSDNKLQAILADSRNSKVVDLTTLNWTTYPVGAGMFQAVWEFGDTYKQPFMTQMATAPTSMATSNLIVYFHGLQNDQVTLVTTSGVLNGIRAGQRKMFVRVEEGLPSAVVGNQPNTGTGITEQQFNTYLTQNLDKKTVVVDDNGLVAVKIYKDLIITHGVLTVDSQGRFVMKDALVALKQPSKHNIGQMNLITADAYGSTAKSRHYILSFNFFNARPIIKTISLTLVSWSGGEHIEPVKWVDYDGQEVTPNGVTTRYANDQLTINITDLNAFRRSDANLLFKHWDEFSDYASTHSNFYSEVRQGLDGGRWIFNPTVDTSLVDYPNSNIHDLLEIAFTFNVYG